MGFGSYDESEQEQERSGDDTEGTQATQEIKGDASDHRGKATTENASREELMKHL